MQFLVDVMKPEFFEERLELEALLELLFWGTL
jgi:hypothetical protein